MLCRQTPLTRSDVGTYVWCQFGWQCEDGVFEWDQHMQQCLVEWTDNPMFGNCPGPIIGASELTYFDPIKKWYSSRDPSVPSRGMRHYGIVYDSP